MARAPKAASAATPPTTGALIDEMWDWKEEKKVLDAAAKALEEKIKAREQELIERLLADDTDRSSGKKANITLRPSIVPQVGDWDKFYAYIKKNNAFHMLERRPSATACREVFDGPPGKNKIPGVEPYEKVSLSVTKK